MSIAAFVLALLAVLWLVTSFASNAFLLYAFANAFPDLRRVGIGTGNALPLLGFWILGWVCVVVGAVTIFVGGFGLLLCCPILWGIAALFCRAELKRLYALERGETEPSASTRVDGIGGPAYVPPRDR